MKKAALLLSLLAIFSASANAQQTSAAATAAASAAARTINEVRLGQSLSALPACSADSKSICWKTDAASNRVFIQNEPFMAGGVDQTTYVDVTRGVITAINVVVVPLNPQSAPTIGHRILMDAAQQWSLWSGLSREAAAVAASGTYQWSAPDAMGFVTVSDKQTTLRLTQVAASGS